MAGFRKAKAEQAAIKAAFYGLAGSGKTFTALLCAEGLAKSCNKRVAYIDTERGTDFYCKAVKERLVHPEAFDFDAVYTKSMMEVLNEVRKLDINTYGVLVIDSITHVWEAAIAAYGGNQTSAGTIPMHAWGKIKKPYKELMTLILASPIHVIICGRQGNEWGEGDDGELKRLGTKMKAEGETPHEPHILIHFEAVPNKEGARIPTAFTEKDRTGILSGRVIPLPNFEKLFKPILPLLGEQQAQMETSDDVAGKDAEAMDEADRAKESASADLLRQFKAKFALCADLDAVKTVAKEITPDVKKQMLSTHVAEAKEAYLEAEKRVKGGK